MALAQKKFLSCTECGKLSPGGDSVAQVQELAEKEGWLVAKQSGSRSVIRTRGDDDYCPEHRGPHDIIYCDSDNPRKDKEGRVWGRDGERFCANQAIVTIVRGDTVVHSCGFHGWVFTKELLTAQPDSTLTVTLITS
jgi:hypothetical protein